MASGLRTVAPGSMTKTADEIVRTVKEQHAVAIVLGLPVNMNGSEGPRAEHVKLFADMLDERLPDVPVLLLDERMTTMAASRFLNETGTRGQKRKQVIDTLSAQIILQNGLDRLKNLDET